VEPEPKSDAAPAQTAPAPKLIFNIGGPIPFYINLNQKKLPEKIALTLALNFASYNKVGLVPVPLYSSRVGAGRA
jgi:hypothetical protein